VPPPLADKGWSLRANRLTRCRTLLLSSPLESDTLFRPSPRLTVLLLLLLLLLVVTVGRGRGLDSERERERSLPRRTPLIPTEGKGGLRIRLGPGPLSSPADVAKLTDGSRVREGSLLTEESLRLRVRLVLLPLVSEEDRDRDRWRCGEDCLEC
jgi:hypothetical protein